MSQSYARSRLMLGITTVGFWVVMATTVLIHQGSGGDLQIQGLSIVASSMLLVAIYIVISIPFDVLGGFILPTRFGRSSMALPCYLISWFRGAMLHGAFLAGVGVLLLELYHLPVLSGTFGLGIVIGISILGQAMLLILQPFMARLLAHFEVKPSDKVSKAMVWQCEDIGFTGGLPVLGVPSILPERWMSHLPKLEFALLEERRSFIRSSFMYPFGIGLSLLLNTVGAVIAHLVVIQQGWLPETIGNVPFLLVWSSVTSLWAFLGLVTLPPLSQWATLCADTVLKPHPQGTVEQLIVHLDTLQDEEYVRPPMIQRVFHPIASVEQRMESVFSGHEPSPYVPYNVARLALYLSWSNLSFMSRAVHCNVGRPHLWVFLPTDG